jgi:hypothetical protein
MLFLLCSFFDYASEGRYRTRSPANVGKISVLGRPASKI